MTRAVELVSTRRKLGFNRFAIYADRRWISPMPPHVIVVLEKKFQFGGIIVMT